jgi:phosphoenolpyruvate phosphomutase
MTRRRSSLRLLLNSAEITRVIGVHDGLGAILAQRAGFEALWVSGLCVSTSRGVADAGLLTMSEFHGAAAEVRRASSLPIIADVDAGFGDVNVIKRMTVLYESAGVDAVCIEDKQYPKRNSFVEDGHLLEPPVEFCRKIAAAKSAQAGTDFIVIARLESLIAGVGMKDALRRAAAYAEAGADALLIHSRESTPHEIDQFCAHMRQTKYRLPILAVPTTYCRTDSRALAAMGVSAVIYANQAMRASVAAMTQMLSDLSRDGSTAALEEHIAPVKELFALVEDETIGDSPWVQYAEESLRRADVALDGIRVTRTASA